MASTRSRRDVAPVALTVFWAGRPRTLALRPWAGALLLVVLPLAAAWYLFASVYLIFHDDLLASLITRQTAMQASYEDRIAGLKAELDLTVGGASDDAASSNAVRDLARRGIRLEARAAALDRLAGSLASAGTPAPAGFGLVPSAPLAPALRRSPSYETGALLPREPTGDRKLDAVAASLDRAEAGQASAVRHLRDPVLQKLGRLKTALAETGLPPSRWGASDVDVGGPFVPMASGDDVDTTIALLRDVALEQGRLGRIADTLPLRKPLAGPLEVTSTFGPRLDPFLGKPAMHTGIDLHKSIGDAVVATGAGIVTRAGPDGGYGNMVEIDHGHGLATRYAHLLAAEVAPGQRVAPGDLVGRVGATGRTTGPHLHYETRIDGEPVDPARFLQAAAILDPR